MKTYGLPLVLALASIWLAAAFAAANAQAASFVDVIIQADGAIDAVSQKIKSAGGEVRFRYRNVPAVAARLPAAEVSALANFTGVTKVEKDRLFYLKDAKLDGAARPRSYVAAQSAHRRVLGLESAELRAMPKGYANFLYTGAIDIWEETGFGDGSAVAVVDTGVARNVALSHAVIGAPGFPNGYNAFPDGAEATDPNNHWHGTVVAGVIAAAAALVLDDPTDPLYVAIGTHMPWWLPANPGEPMVVPIVGQAPGAQIYPVKVFPQDGGGTPTSIILDGLDHILTLKKNGLLDIDIVNMSLGGPTLWDGLDVFDRFIFELTAAHILTVVSAGNEGPIPNSIGSPGTSLASVSVGALDYAPSSRVLYEWLGQVSGFGTGMGLVMRPTEEVRVVNFSSRGPLSDGRAGPDITALGQWNFGVNPQDGLLWVGGTSFASPTVAGVGALLNADWENGKHDTAPLILEAALLRGADSHLVGAHWRSVNFQGYGVVNAPDALKALRKKHSSVDPNSTGPLKANILGHPIKSKTQKWTSDRIALDPSESFDAVLEVNRFTSKVTVEIYDIEAPDNSLIAFWPNALEVHVQSAKRGAAEHPVFVYWYPFFYGDSFTIEIEDGPWTLAGNPWSYQPMEPGLMKISVIGDYSNQNEVGCKMRVSRENHLQPLKNPIAHSVIRSGDGFVFPVQVPPGTKSATFDLQWRRDWSAFPTSDLDLLVFDVNGNLVSLDGATINSPERAILANPTPGTYYLVVDAFEVYKPDQYELFMSLE